MTFERPSKPSTQVLSSAPLPNPSLQKSPLRIALISNHRRFKVYFRGYPWGRELAKRGHDVDLFCHADSERLSTKIETIDGFRIVENPDLLVGAARQGWDPYCAVRRAAFMFGESKPYDIIHCLDTRLAVIWPALAYARRKGIPIVSDWIDWWGRGGLIEERRPEWYKSTLGGVETWFEEHYRAELDGLSTISHALKERGIALGCDRDKTIVVNGAADMATFANPVSRSSARAVLGLPQDAPIVCFSGLDVLIDLPLAVRAFENIRTAMPTARLLLVGPTQQDAQQCASTTEALAAITATGRVAYAKLPEVLPAADLFLLPYPDKIVNVGRWPNKIGDYMAVGRATVTNPVGELVQLFSRYEIGAMAGETAEQMGAAAIELFQTPERMNELGRNARKVAETDLSWSSQIAGLESWYYSIVKAHSDGLSA